MRSLTDFWRYLRLTLANFLWVPAFLFIGQYSQGVVCCQSREFPGYNLTPPDCAQSARSAPGLLPVPPLFSW